MLRPHKGKFRREKLCATSGSMRARHSGRLWAVRRNLRQRASHGGNRSQRGPERCARAQFCPGSLAQLLQSRASRPSFIPSCYRVVSGRVGLRPLGGAPFVPQGKQARHPQSTGLKTRHYKRRKERWRPKRDAATRAGSAESRPICQKSGRVATRANADLAASNAGSISCHGT
jgi:hypothetical protein